MESEECVIALFDLYWFRTLILRRNPPSTPADITPTIAVDSEPLPQVSTPSLLLRRRHRRSRSHEIPPIPSLRIQTAKLHSLLSSNKAPKALPDEKTRERRKKGGNYKSLSDLEFDELKGLIDLGFAFSEVEVADPRLIPIVQGLQRIGAAVHCGIIPPAKIPATAKVRGDAVLRNWRIPAAGEGVDLKDHIRLWGHSVASAVR